MKEHYVLYDCAVKLKELGFDFEVNQYYNDKKILIEYLADSDYNNGQWDSDIQCSAPRLDQAQAWLREVKGIAINVIAHDGGKWEYDIVFLPNAADETEIVNRSPWCRTYEEALTEGLAEALELCYKEKEEKK